MNVLVVEDDAWLREGMAELIGELAEVRDAGTVAEALCALRESTFDLVMSDLRIDGSPDGGRRLVQAAREHLVPIVVVSAMAPDEVRSILREDPADAVLSKPFGLDDALEVAGRFLERRKEVTVVAERVGVPEAERFTRELETLHRAVIEEDGDRQISVFRILPGATVDRVVPETRFSLLLKGALKLGDGDRGGVRRAGETLHVPAGTHVRVSAPDGALGVTIRYRHG